MFWKKLRRKHSDILLNKVLSKLRGRNTKKRRMRTSEWTPRLRIDVLDPGYLYTVAGYPVETWRQVTAGVGMSSKVAGAFLCRPKKFRQSFRQGSRYIYE